MIRRGEIYLLSPAPDPRDPKARRACVVVSRRTLCESSFGKVVVAAIHTAPDGLSTEVALGVDEGMKWSCVIKADQLFLVEKARLTNFVASLRAPKVRELNQALSIALDLI